jgi:ERCC4-type nuclease
MISIDNREIDYRKRRTTGERAIELQPLIEAQGIPTRLLSLPYGDYYFEGKGPSGPALVGVERKKPHDMANAIRSGRFSGHQLPGLVGTYDFPFLIIEGGYQANPDDGALEIPAHGGWKRIEFGPAFGRAKGPQCFLHAELDNFLTTISLLTPVRVRRSNSATDTARQIINLYRYFNGKEWEDHHAHQAFCAMPDPGGMLGKIGLVRRWAKELRGIGWERSKAVADQFSTPREMAEAGVKEWEGVPGIGSVIAQRVVKAISTGRED